VKNVLLTHRNHLPSFVSSFGVRDRRQTSIKLSYTRDSQKHGKTLKNNKIIQILTTGSCSWALIYPGTPQKIYPKWLIIRKIRENGGADESASHLAAHMELFDFHGVPARRLQLPGLQKCGVRLKYTRKSSNKAWTVRKMFFLIHMSFTGRETADYYGFIPKNKFRIKFSQPTSGGHYST